MNIRTLIVALASVGLWSCAAMKEAYIAHNCHAEGAFALGMNDAREGKQMNPNALSLCPEKDRAVAMKQYRDGYTEARGSRGQTLVLAGQLPPQDCVEAYGKKACGYNCIQGYGKVACAQHPNHNCVEAYGKLRCGDNCRESFGKIVCN